MLGGSFTADITAIRERARRRMEEGPVTGSYGKDPEDVVAVLNEVLATEIVCWMRYTRHAISATGMNRAQVASEFTTYQEIIRWLGDGDPTTRRLLEGILADEEEHAGDLVDLLGA